MWVSLPAELPNFAMKSWTGFFASLDLSFLICVRDSFFISPLYLHADARDRGSSKQLIVSCNRFYLRAFYRA